MGMSVLPVCCLAWGQTMVGIMAVMATSFKRIFACTVVVSVPDTAAGHRWHMHPLETPGLSQANLTQSLVWTLLLSPGFWCAQGFVCALQKSLSPVCGSSVINSQWPPKANSLGVLSPFPTSSCWEIYLDPRAFLTVWEFIWYNCSTVCGSSALWLCSGAKGNLLPRGLMPHASYSRSATARAHVPTTGHCWPVPP